MLYHTIVLAQADAPAPAPAAPANAPKGGAEGMIIWVPLIVMIVAMFWITSRSQKKQRERHQEMVNALQKGSDVVIAGGLYGKIVEVKDDSFLVEIAKDTRVEVAKGAINARPGKEETPEKGK